MMDETKACIRARMESPLKTAECRRRRIAEQDAEIRIKEKKEVRDAEKKIQSENERKIEKES